jgi:hypothetical protein
MMKKVEILLFVLLMVVIVPLEVACAFLAHETIGEVTSALYFLALGINLLFVLLAVRSRSLAAIGAVILALLIIPYQVMLGQRLLRVQAEAARIVAFAYEHKINSGEYPLDLSGYAFNDQEMKKYVQSYSTDESRGGFVLCYRVGTETASHWYDPDGGWGYYPD